MDWSVRHEKGGSHNTSLIIAHYLPLVIHIILEGIGAVGIVIGRLFDDACKMYSEPQVLMLYNMYATNFCFSSMNDLSF